MYPSYLAGLAAYKRDWHWAKDQEADESYEEGGIGYSLGGSFDAGASHGSRVEAEGEDAFGRRIDHETGVNTVYHRTAVSVNGELAVPGASASGMLKGVRAWARTSRRSSCGSGRRSST